MLPEFHFVGNRRILKLCQLSNISQCPTFSQNFVLERRQVVGRKVWASRFLQVPRETLIADHVVVYQIIPLADPPGERETKKVRYSLTPNQRFRIIESP